MSARSSTTSRMVRVKTVIVDEILVGVGRSPNLEGLNLEAAGVKYDSCRGGGGE